MKQLSVSLQYGTANFGRRGGPDAAFALPIKVLDVEGSVLAESAATVDRPAGVQLPDDTGLVFVRLTWPSGRSQTQRVDLSGRADGSVAFTDQRISPNEWSAWAVPKLNPNTPLATPEGRVDLDLDRFDNVWLRLWRLDRDVWTMEKMTPDAVYRSPAAWQLDLTLSSAPWLLQLGSPKVPWRFVSLPGGGPARVLLTPKDSNDPRADELKVVVTSGRADAETLLEFLSRDSMRAVSSLANSTAFARNLLQQKFEDPVSAVAGAYYLLRVDRWNEVPLSWFENLSRHFAWLPDAAIVHCVRLLREGTDAAVSERTPQELFVQSLRRGWPVYAEGINLLQEAASSLRGASRTRDLEGFETVRALGSAKAWAGAAASFYGKTPAQPSTQLWVGSPHAPRRRLPGSMTVRAMPIDSAFKGVVLGLAETPPVKRLPGKTAAPAKKAAPAKRAPPAKEAAPAAPSSAVTFKVAAGSRSDDDEFFLGSIP